MRYLRSLVLIATVLFLPLQGQNPFQLNSAPEKQEAPLPDPINLGPQWWSYFEVDAEQLSERIAAFEQRLNAIRDTLPEEQRETANVLIDRIVVNLRALPEVLKKQVESPPVSPGYQESYTLTEVLDLAKRSRTVNLECERESIDLRRQKEMLKTSEKYIDNLFLTYQGQEEGSASRFITGLEIIANTAALAISREQQRVNESLVENQEVGCKLVSEELDAALDRVDIAATDASTLDEDLNVAKGEVDRAKEALVTAESKLVSMVGQQDKMRSTYHLLSQKVVSSEVDLLYAEMHLLSLEIKKALMVVHDNHKVDDRSYREQIDSWEKTISDAKETIKRNRQATLRERDRLLKFIAVKEDGVTVDQTETFQQERYKEVQDTLARLQAAEDEIFRSNLIIGLLREELTKHQPYWINLATAIWQNIREAQEPIMNWFDTSLFKVGKVPVTPLEILQAILILFVTLWVSRLVRHAIDRVSSVQKTAELATIYVVKKLAHYIILTLGVIIALSALGFNFQNLAIILGALSVGIGFGLQNVVNNFLCGLIILFGRNVKVGDLIELESGQWGRVTEVKVQNTTIHTYRGIDVIVPNAVLIGNRVLNWTRKNPYQRMHIPFSVAYGSDKEYVEKVVLEAVEKHPITQQRLAHHSSPQVWLVKFGDNALEMELVVWVNLLTTHGRGSIFATYLWEIDTALRKAGITVPFPQLDLHLKDMPDDFFETYAATKGVPKKG